MTTVHWRSERWFQSEPYPCMCCLPADVVRDRNGHHYDPTRKVVLGVQKCPEWRRWYMDCLERKRLASFNDADDLDVVGIK